MWPLPIRELYMAGSSSVCTLEKLEVRTIGDLARMDPASWSFILRAMAANCGNLPTGSTILWWKPSRRRLKGSAIRSLSPGTPDGRRSLPGA